MSCSSSPVTYPQWRRWQPDAPDVGFLSYVIPAFSFTGLIWLGASHSLTEFRVSAGQRLAFQLPTKPTGANYVLCLRSIVDGVDVRYKLWDDALAVIPWPLYTGQILDGDFAIEVWTTNRDECSSDDDITLTTGIIQPLASRCGCLTDPTTTELTETADIFSELPADPGVDTGYTGPLLIFNEPYSP